MQLLGLAEIQLAEDLSSVRVLEWVPVTWKYTKFTQFWSSRGFAAIWLNKFLSGEFRVFRGKMVIIWLSLWVLRLFKQINSFLENFMFFTENGHYWLWALPWKFGIKIKFDRTKFVLFVVKVTDWVVS